MTGRMLEGPILTVGVPTLSIPEREVISTRGVALFRLVPVNEAISLKHRSALRLSRGKLTGLAVEVPPIAYGSFADGKIQFILPSDFDPDTSCFTVVAASGYVVETSPGWSADKRYLLGLYPYSKRYHSDKSPQAVKERGPAKLVYSDSDLECEGTMADFANNRLTSAGW